MSGGHQEMKKEGMVEKELLHMQYNFVCLNNQIFKFTPELGGERNMKQRIPINSITSKLVLTSMYASCSTGPFFADH